jgi:hypothetical protein
MKFQHFVADYDSSLTLHDEHIADRAAFQSKFHSASLNPNPEIKRNLLERVMGANVTLAQPTSQ